MRSDYEVWREEEVRGFWEGIATKNRGARDAHCLGKCHCSFDGLFSRKTY